MAVELVHADLTEKIISAYYEVYNALGYGFLEKVYENAMVIALRKRGLEVKQQWPIHVHFDGEVVGEYFADLFVIFLFFFWVFLLFGTLLFLKKFSLIVSLSIIWSYFTGIAWYCWYLLVFV